MAGFIATDDATTARPGLSELEARIYDATLRCIARWGVSKTTLDDVAREARCGRATIYRTVAGGKAALLEAVAHHEIGRLYATIDDRLREAETLEDLLVAGITTTGRLISEHRAFQFLLAHEPDLVLPYFAFDRMRILFHAATTFAAPHLARFLPEREAHAAAEWAVRVLISYTLCPSSSLDLTRDNDTHHLVRTYLLPGLTLMAADAPSPSHLGGGA